MAFLTPARNSQARGETHTGQGSGSIMKMDFIARIWAWFAPFFFCKAEPYERGDSTNAPGNSVRKPCSSEVLSLATAPLNNKGMSPGGSMLAHLDQIYGHTA